MAEKRRHRHLHKRNAWYPRPLSETNGVVPVWCSKHGAVGGVFRAPIDRQCPKCRKERQS